MHKNQLYPNTPICLFLIGNVEISKFCTLKLIFKDYYDYIIKTYLLI